MKYGVNRVTLVGNVGEVPRVSEREGEAFVANFPLATNEMWRDKEGEEVRRTEWQHSVVDVVTFISATYSRSMLNCVH
jgi:single stranded DNA-binding protein